MDIERKNIEQYLFEVKEAVEKDNYRIDRNSRRQGNINLFLDYVIDEAKAKEIILDLNAMDFSTILQNNHKGFEHENLYVFGKDVILLERNGTGEKTVSLYILSLIHTDAADDRISVDRGGRRITKKKINRYIHGETKGARKKHNTSRRRKLMIH